MANRVPRPKNPEEKGFEVRDRILQFCLGHYLFNDEGHRGLKREDLANLLNTKWYVIRGTVEDLVNSRLLKKVEYEVPIRYKVTDTYCVKIIQRCSG